jgi:hypothetical protein
MPPECLTGLMAYDVCLPNRRWEFDSPVRYKANHKRTYALIIASLRVDLNAHVIGCDGWATPLLVPVWIDGRVVMQRPAKP